MQRIELEVNKRDTTRKARAVRRAGQLPGVFYGAGGANVPVEVDAHQFTKLGLGSSGAHLIRFKSSEPALNDGVALVRDLQSNPLTGRPIHVDFLRVDPTKPVEASVVLSFVGKAPGVVEGGILQPLRREIDVRALPDRLPSVIEVDVGALNIHDSVHVEELGLPEGVEAVYQENFTVVTVVPPAVEAAPVEEELEEVAAAPEGAAPAAGEGAEDTTE
jgi:large subunit ribosomal protein L25